MYGIVDHGMYEVRCGRLGTGLSRHWRQLAGAASKLYGYNVNVVTISQSTSPDYDYSKKTFLTLESIINQSISLQYLKNLSLLINYPRR